MKGISLLTKGKNTCEALKTQLCDLMGQEVAVKGYFLDGLKETGITDDLIVISSNDIYQEAIKHINPCCPVILAQRSINYHEIEKLLNLPSGTQVLFVNDLASTTNHTINSLKALGIDHIVYHPYFPGARGYPELKTAVTPGELELVPDFVEHIVDIKSRNIDLATIIEIYKTLGLSDEKTGLLSAKYIKDIIELIKTTKRMADINYHIRNQLQTIINEVHDGIIALDERDIVSVFNPVAEDIFGFPRESILGKGLDDKTIHKNIASTLTSVNRQDEQFIKVNNRHIVVNRSYIKSEENPVGTLYTLKDVTEIQRLEEELRRKIISQENYARYTLDNIIGDSQLIKTTKELAKRISRSDSPVLVSGESGTGKELFAQAIHNESRRRKYPFVAVNFAALPESLLESELFGYDEGAFTGARKGGMPGLFEQAHGGTIFLDEIGDSPVYFQIRLLRVLQEKQVRRIGSSRVIPVDVRVISATNKNLKTLIENGEFRQDLYYRLNVLPLRVPPLRQRKQDIMDLAANFMKEYSKGRFKNKTEDYFALITECLLSYNWPGNIRELNNIIEYLVSVCPDEPPERSLLPEEMQISPGKCEKVEREHRVGTREILLAIKSSNSVEEPIGRRSLAKKTGISEGKIRRIISDMNSSGYITVNRGIKGLYLTDKGEKELDGLNNG